jgi:hypothetical protein
MSVRKTHGAAASGCLQTLTGCLLIRGAGSHSAASEPPHDLDRFASSSFTAAGSQRCVGLGHRFFAARSTVCMPLLFGSRGGCRPAQKALKPLESR